MEHRNRNRKKILGSSAIFLPLGIQKANSDRMVPNYIDQQNKAHGYRVELSESIYSGVCISEIKDSNSNVCFTYTRKCPRPKENPAAQKGCSIGESFTFGILDGCILNLMCTLGPGFHSYLKSHIIDLTKLTASCVSG